MSTIDQGDLFDAYQPPDDSGGENENNTLSIAQYAEQAYLDYALSVVRGRALPELGDGQKPVQRRILYAMQAMGLQAGSRPVKSARVVGDVLGKYHPHGDQAAYDALVRMAQSFTLRYPLIDGQGNFGSRDGDNAAAMRYTEARLTPIARILLDELSEGTVDFVSNYDGSQTEPAALPARLPMMLLNGASGIAVGMATEIPPHNLNEVVHACIALVRNPKLDDNALHSLLPGPDFPGGGQIITSAAEVAHIYATGRGSIKVRARYQFEELARGQWQCIITELPPGTSGQKILEEIEEITNPKIKTGKKALSTDQQQAKAQMLALLDAVRDESGKDAAVRLVFEPKTSRIDRDTLITTLLAQTSLETNAPINLVCVGTDGRPRQKGLREILLEWVTYRSQTIMRRSEHRLAKVLDRIHVLEGRMSVYLNVDEVIQTIRAADEPKMALMQRFKLSERQAEDILEMRLRQLARLEGIRIEQELKDKKTEQTQLEELIQKPAALQRLMIKEIEADAKQFGDNRRTLIEAAERAVLTVKVIDEPVTVVVSNKGWVRTRPGHQISTDSLTYKPGDHAAGQFECRTTDLLSVFGTNGRVYTVPVASLPGGRGDGNPLTAMINLEPGTQVLKAMAAAPETPLFIATASGFGFQAQFKNLFSKQKAGKQFVTLEEGDFLLAPLALSADDTHIALLTHKIKIVLLSRDDIKIRSAGGRGTILMALEAPDKVEQTTLVNQKGLTVEGLARGKAGVDVWSVKDLLPYVSQRARKGKLFDTRLKSPRFKV